MDNARLFDDAHVADRARSRRGTPSSISSRTSRATTSRRRCAASPTSRSGSRRTSATSMDEPGARAHGPAARPRAPAGGADRRHPRSTAAPDRIEDADRRRRRRRSSSPRSWSCSRRPPTRADRARRACRRSRTARVPLQQVLMNLIGNALKYNRGRDAHRRGRRAAQATAVYDVLRHRQRRRHRARVPRAHLGHVPDARAARQGRGHRHRARGRAQDRRGRGGRAWVESDAGAGATFCFTLACTTSTRTRDG